jgi:D-amino peptidase
MSRGTIDVKRIYIVVDMEGVSGIRLREQCAPGTVAWQEARPWIASDVNAAISAAFDCGVEEVLVCDSHANCNNLPLDLLDSRALVEQPYKHQLLPGLTEEFAGLFVIGAHARAGTADAFMDHTWNLTWFRYKLAGDDCGEIGMWAAYAGHFSVPLLMVSGDAAVCREAEDFVPGVEAVGVKEAIARDCARTMSPQVASKWIAEAAERALGRIGEIEPAMVDLPNEVELEYTKTEYADEAGQRSGTERTGPRSVQRELGSTLDLIKGF